MEFVNPPPSNSRQILSCLPVSTSQGLRSADIEMMGDSQLASSSHHEMEELHYNRSLV